MPAKKGNKYAVGNDGGRPSTYDDKKAIQICELTASSSKSLATIAKEVGVPYGTIRSWLQSQKEFSALYARAKQDQADYLAEEILSIADDSSQDTIIQDLGDGIQVERENREFVNRSKLRVDARKWIASKLKPKSYGDRLDVTSADKAINPISPEILQAIADKINNNSKKT